ncbi:hypothetical protein PLIIFM63780_004476 [Purpureocillium lilacinum]|nr:hypothetical protein PLIIFM63780_004476 [Purpureocillium lilacinum]
MQEPMPTVGGEDVVLGFVGASLATQASKLLTISKGSQEQNVASRNDHTQAAANSSSSFVTSVWGPKPNGKAVRDCHVCRSTLSAEFDIPPAWWGEHYLKASSYFGFREIPQSGAKQEGAGEIAPKPRSPSAHQTTASWCRFKVKHTASLPKQAEADYHWAKLNVFSRWYKAPNHTVVLIFDPEKMRKGDETLRDEFERSLTDLVGEEDLADPFWIYPPLVDFVVRAQDKAVWQIRDLVRNIEKSREHRKGEASILQSVIFLNMYNVQRHAVHVCETLEVAISTTEWIEKHHDLFLNGLQAGSKSAASKNITNGLLDKQNFLTVLLHRSDANKSRLNSEIGLAFNTVSVEIANATKRDSAAMRTIAFVSLLFLPATFTSAIFSTTFFKFDDNSSAWEVSGMFWLYWVVAIPLTVAAVLVWYGKSLPDKLVRLHRRVSSLFGQSERRSRGRDDDGPAREESTSVRSWTEKGPTGMC